ncbi:MAG TPA: efflux RND transporter periplasmic adaptor subunit [Cyclobacteriaceae bacterium]|nr:efflux RND transporter periplasmic adaptor subunit [Cyclobacteriaceae bacterium]
MKNTSLIITLASALVFAACSGEQSEQTLIEKKRTELAKAQKEYEDLRAKVAAIEKELKEIDPSFVKSNTNAILVSTFSPEKQAFEHKMDVRGAVESRRNVLISAIAGGEIKTVHVKEGQPVKKGDLLISLDADIIRNNIAELKTALDLAKTVHEKQERLWKQNIGTEIQYLQAKNNKESLERRLATANSQLDQAIIRAPFTGTVDEVRAREGEMAAPGMPLLRMVNPDEMYIKADVSERFIGRFNAGDQVEVYFPSVDKNINTRISSVGQVINPENRTFMVEILLPANIAFTLKPNQVSVIRMRDYFNPETYVLPTKLVQRDDQGTFVFGLIAKGEQQYAQKIYVETGYSYESQTEIINSFKGNEVLVDKGFRDLTEGVEVVIADGPQPVAKNGVALKK